MSANKIYPHTWEFVSMIHLSLDEKLKKEVNYYPTLHCCDNWQDVTAQEGVKTIVSANGIYMQHGNTFIKIFTGNV